MNEHVIKQLDDLRQLINTFTLNTTSVIEEMIKELGPQSACVYRAPEIDRVNGQDQNGYYEEFEVSQSCIAHPYVCQRSLAWINRDIDADVYQPMVPVTRQLFATIPAEPTWTLAQRVLAAWESVHQGA
jgi:hypothetical protein